MSIFSSKLQNSCSITVKILKNLLRKHLKDLRQNYVKQFKVNVKTVSKPKNEKFAIPLYKNSLCFHKMTSGYHEIVQRQFFFLPT